MDNKFKRIVIIGAGGHAKMIAGSIIRSGSLELLGFVSEFKKNKKEKIFGKKIFSKIENIREFKKVYYIIGIGDNKIRKETFKELENNNYNLLTIVDKSAIINHNVEIEKGCFIGPGAIVNVNSKIGENSIINSGAIVEHDCAIGKNCHLAPGSRIAGYVNIGDNSFLGIGSTVKDKVIIGKKVILGAGSVALKDIDDNAVMVGIPAKKIKDNM